MINSSKYLAIAMLTLGLVAEIVSSEADFESINKQLFSKDAPLLDKSRNRVLLRSLLPLAEENNVGTTKINLIKRLISAADPDEKRCQPEGFNYLFYIDEEFSTPNLEAYAATRRKEQLDICRSLLVENITSFSGEERSIIARFSGESFTNVRDSITNIIKEKTGPKRPLLEKHRVALFEKEYAPIEAICDSVSDKIEPLTQLFGQFMNMPEIVNDKLIKEWTQKADFCHQMKYPTLGDRNYLSKKVFNQWV